MCCFFAQQLLLFLRKVKLVVLYKINSSNYIKLIHQNIYYLFINKICINKLHLLEHLTITKFYFKSRALPYITLLFTLIRGDITNEEKGKNHKSKCDNQTKNGEKSETKQGQNNNLYNYISYPN